MRPEILIAISLINLALVDAYLLRAVRDLQGTLLWEIIKERLEKRKEE